MGPESHRITLALSLKKELHSLQSTPFNAVSLAAMRSWVRAPLGPRRMLHMVAEPTPASSRGAACPPAAPIGQTPRDRRCGTHHKANERRYDPESVPRSASSRNHRTRDTDDKPTMATR